MLHGTVFGTIFYPLALAACVCGVYFYRKSCHTLNGFVWMVLSFLVTIATGGIIAGILSPLHIPVNLYSMGVVYFLLGGGLFYRIRKEGKKQSYIWEKYDVLLLAGITLVVVAICIRQFSPSLEYCYYNTDAGLHLKEATLIVRTQKVTMMYFMHLQNAMVIEMVSPFVRTAELFKGYILGDCFFLWVEALFFAALIRRFVNSLWEKIFGVVILAAYFWGYPYFGYFYSFGYWGMGAMYVGFLAICLRLYEEAEVERKYTVFMLMTGCFGVITSYMFFAPMAFIAVFFYLMTVAGREGKVFTLKNVFLALKVFLIPTIFGLCYCLYGFFISSGTSITGALGNAGGIYTELYMDFFWTFFPVIFVIVHTLKKKRLTPEVFFFGASFLFAGGLLFLTLTHHVSTYYYYKSYYPLWMFGWVLVMIAVGIMIREARETLAAYCILIAAFAVLCFSGIENRIVISREKITGASHSPAFFTLYQFNRYLHGIRFEGLSHSLLDLYQTVIDDLSEEKMVPLMTEELDYGPTYVYEGISGYDFPDFYEWRHTEKELRQAYYDWDIHYAVMLKDSHFEKEHGKKVLKMEGVSVYMENESGYILKIDLP